MKVLNGSGMRRRLFGAAWFVALVHISCASGAGSNAQRGAGTSPATAVDELVRADRAFAEASADTDLVSGISAMFAADVATAVPGARFSTSSAEAIAALRAVPGNATARANWAPVRAGISADGTHGFTLGYMTVHNADHTVTPMKYLSYWVKQPDGWRVVAYRRRPRAEDAAGGAMTYVLPGNMVAPVVDDARTQQLRASVDSAERTFARDAQSIGLQAAFARWGSDDAWFMGGPADNTFIIGAAAIARSVGVDEPATGSSVNWGPDRVRVASSGDLGVSIGMIVVNQQPADGSAPARFPFFTVWRRSNSDSPWRYLAE